MLKPIKMGIFLIEFWWIFISIAFSKLIEVQTTIGEPVFLGKFGGDDIIFEISCSIIKGYQESALWNNKLQLFVWDNQREYTCADIKTAIFDAEIFVPAFGSWSHDQRGNFTLNNMGFFYIADCDRDFTTGASVAVKLEIKDSIGYHLSWESYGLKKSYISCGLIYSFMIILILCEIKREKHDEAPLVIICIICALNLFSIIFEFLYIWIYEMDGNSYRLFLVFAKIFDGFSTNALIGVMILISAKRFDPKSFMIEEYEFNAFIIMLIIEYILAIIDIFISSPMEKFNRITRVDGKIYIGFRLIYLYLLVNYNKAENFKNQIDNTFRRIKLFGTIYLLNELLIMVLLLPFAYYGEDCIKLILQNSITLAILIYLLTKFCKLEGINILPLKKSHKV